MGWLFPRSGETREANLESFCASYPYNSRCQDYLSQAGVIAVNSQGNPVAPSQVLANAQPGNPVPVQGLSNTTYLVIKEGPEIARYGISPVCPHQGCIVDWKPQQDRFVCPCHGSEFDAQGRVEEGPAINPLPLVTVVAKDNRIRLLKRENSETNFDPRNQNYS